jgi:hypothetical protein
VVVEVQAEVQVVEVQAVAGPVRAAQVGWPQEPAVGPAWAPARAVVARATPAGQRAGMRARPAA